MKKICNKCLTQKNIDHFYKNKNTNDGYNNICKECRKQTDKKYYKKNILKIKEYRDSKKEKMKEYLKKYYQTNIERIKELRKINEENIKLKTKEYYKNNSEKIKKYSKNYNSLNKEKKQLYTKEYQKENRKSINKRDEFRRNNNPIYKISRLMRSRMKKFLKIHNITKKNTTFHIIGCTPQELKEHLEKQFINGMDWSNHKQYGWHIDHIIPLSTAKNEEDLYKLCHYTNLQPLWWEDNLKKSNKTL